jgi:hypothetical protein
MFHINEWTHGSNELKNDPDNLTLCQACMSELNNLEYVMFESENTTNNFCLNLLCLWSKVIEENYTKTINSYN